VLQAGRPWVRFPMRLLNCFNLSNPSSRNIALRSTQLLTKNEYHESSWGGRGRPVRKADNFTAICEPIVYKMWEPLRLTTLWAFTACYRDSFAVFYPSFLRPISSFVPVCSPILSPVFLCGPLLYMEGSPMAL
jgi:hypothetical protein